MIRLQIDAEGQLSPVQRGTPGCRSAWVCPTRTCIQRIEKNPRGLSRALRASPLPSTAALQLRCAAALWAQVLVALERCRRAGLVVSGAHQLAQAAELCVVLVAQGAGSGGYRGDTVVVPAGSAALGGLVGKGPRAALGVRAGSPTNLLQECLQRYCSVR